MDPKLRLTLSPVALASVLALAGLQSAAPVPWFSAGPAQANHCAPPCDCACACDCDCYGCDANCGCGADPDDDLD